MTIDELKAIPFHFVCSVAWEDEEHDKEIKVRNSLTVVRTYSTQS